MQGTDDWLLYYYRAAQARNASAAVRRSFGPGPGLASAQCASTTAC